MKIYTYLFVDFACIVIPFLASFYKKYPFYKTWKSYFLANGIIGFLFIVWDIYFTKIGVWGFNTDYLSGFYIYNLPIEEILFFICIPYSCVFTYFSLKSLLKSNFLISSYKFISYVLLIMVLVLGLYFFDKKYTSTTFLLTSAYLFFNIIKKKNMSWIYLTYISIFPFFLLSNGILTGSFLENPIVWYDDTENLGIRIFTIPVEDSIYGFLLISSTISLYDYFRND